MTAPTIRQTAEVLRELPIDINNEKNLISCLLQKPALLREETLFFSVEDFHFGPHERIVQAMIDLDAEGIVPDSGMIANRLTDPSEKDYLLNLTETMWASPSNALHYVLKLKEVAAKRRALFDANKLQKAALSGVPDDIARVREEISRHITTTHPSSVFQSLIKNRVNIAQATSTQPPPQKYVVGHLPDEPGAYGLIIGPDGSRKSWLALHIALAVSCGKPVAQGVDGSCLWSAPEPGRVVYLSSEDSRNVLYRRTWSLAQLPGYGWVESAEENLDLFATYSGLTLLTMDPDGKSVPTPEYADLVEYATGSRLIILDPLSDLFDIAESDDRAARGAVQILRDLSLKTGAGVLGIHHQNKVGMMNGEKHHQSGRGSSRFGAGCRWAVVLQPMPPEEAAAHGIEKYKDWTGIYEGKASYYDEATGDLWFRRHVIDDGEGKILAFGPASALIPEEDYKKKRRLAGEIEDRKAKNAEKRGKKGIEADEHEGGKTDADFI